MRATCPSTRNKAKIMEHFTHPILDPHSRVSRNISIRATRLARSGAVPGMEPEDVAQELRLHLLRRESRFRPERGQYDTFADRVLTNRAATLAAPTHRLHAERLWTSFDTPINTSAEAGSLSWGEFLPQNAALHAPARAVEDAICLVLDVQHLLSRLTPLCRAVAIELANSSVAEAASVLLIHRSTVYACLATIRRVAIDLGLDNYLGPARQIRPRAGM
jgi:DNA-directed RNA polymerase specialized sigma24 family protein